MTTIYEEVQALLQGNLGLWPPGPEARAVPVTLGRKQGGHGEEIRVKITPSEDAFTTARAGAAFNEVTGMELDIWGPDIATVTALKKLVIGLLHGAYSAKLKLSRGGWLKEEDEATAGEFYRLPISIEGPIVSVKPTTGEVIVKSTESTFHLQPLTLPVPTTSAP